MRWVEVEKLYLTPDTLPATKVVRTLEIPNDPVLLAAVNAALLSLTQAENWEPYGPVTPEDAAQAMLVAFVDYLNS